MATNPAVMEDSKQEFWRGTRRDLLSFPSLLFAGVCLSANWWVTPLTYFFLWTYRIGPSGLIPKVLLVVFSVISVALIYTLFSTAVRLGKQVRPYRLAAKDGDQDAIDQLTVLRRSKPRPLRLFVCFTFVILALAPMSAIILMDGDQGGFYAIPDHGKLRASTRSEDVEQKLTVFRRRGIFRTVD